MIRKTTEGITIRQQDKYLTHRWSVPRNRWDLKLGTAKPYRLRLKTGVNQGELNLGGLPITDLDLETGVSENSINFNEKNPSKMESDQLKYESRRDDDHDATDRNEKPNLNNDRSEKKKEAKKA